MDTSKPITVQAILEAPDLSGLSTRHLLALSKRFALYGYDYDNEEFEDSPNNRAVRRLRVELASRPHVPNKKEGKKLRQLAAKRKT